MVKFGLIPELVGRMPVITALNRLDETALVRILTEPKNCLVNQYKKLFQLDKVELEFQPEALRAIAKKTLERKTGRPWAAFHYGGNFVLGDVRCAVGLYGGESCDYARDRFR